MTEDLFERAQRIAVDHVLWAAAEGLGPREVMAEIRMPWTGRRQPDWHDCILAVSIAWRRLRAGGLDVAEELELPRAGRLTPDEVLMLADELSSASGPASEAVRR